ncbi:MAG: PEP-CTERM sorting domain-containing protein [Cyanobacteria bacterium P01_G01_bin.49]
MDNLLKKVSFSIATAMIVLSFPTSAKAFSFYDDEVDGDLSNDGLNPTELGSLSLGTNALKATFNAVGNNPDADYFTFSIPKGQALEGIILQSWNASPTFEDIAFIAMQEGTVFDYTYDSSNPTAEGLLGWSHLRSTQVGTNKILSEMAVSNQTPESVGLDLVFQEEAASSPYTPEQLIEDPELVNKLANLAGTWQAGATGFNTPLGPGDYSIWLRQGSETEITVELDFNTKSVPEPGSILGIMIALGLGTLVTKKVKQS